MKLVRLLLWSMATAASLAAAAHEGEIPQAASTPAPAETAPAAEAGVPVSTPVPPAQAEAAASPVPASTAAPADDQAVVKAVVEDFHRAQVEGYREGVLKLLDERAVIFETGYVEVDRDQYATNHLDSDLMFAAQVKREVVHTQATVTGDTAVVLTQSRSAGEFMGAKIKLENAETMVLRRGADGWKIVHIHWSGHDRASDDVPNTPETQ